MAFLVSTIPYGLGSSTLSLFMRGSLGQLVLKGASAPTITSAFLYGAATSLVNRSIEHIGAEVCEHYHLGEKETLIVTIGVIALNVLSAYEVAKRLGPILGTEISPNFIHLENALYIASILELDFDMTVQRMNNRVWTEVVDSRYHSVALGWIQTIWNEIQNIGA